MTPESGPEPKFWQIPLADLEQRLGADRNGLSSAEVAARRLRYGPNTLEERRRLSLSLKFLSRFRIPLVLILLAAAAISALTGDLASFIIISTIVLVLGCWGRTSSPVMSCCSPPGTLVPADGRLLEARDFFVNEALLTGESFPTEKHARDEGVDSPEAPMRPTPPLWAVQ